MYILYYKIYKKSKEERGWQKAILFKLLILSVEVEIEHIAKGIGVAGQHRNHHQLAHIHVAEGRIFILIEYHASHDNRHNITKGLLLGGSRRTKIEERYDLGDEIKAEHIGNWDDGLYLRIDNIYNSDIRISNFSYVHRLLLMDNQIAHGNVFNGGRNLVNHALKIKSKASYFNSLRGWGL